jgi:hypothetical protein
MLNGERATTLFAEELVQLLREVRHAKVGPLRFRANTLRKEGRHAEAAATHAEADALVAGILRRAAEATRHREHCTPQPASSLRVPHLSSLTRVTTVVRRRRRGAEGGGGDEAARAGAGYVSALPPLSASRILRGSLESHCERWRRRRGGKEGGGGGSGGAEAAEGSGGGGKEGSGGGGKEGGGGSGSVGGARAADGALRGVCRGMCFDNADDSHPSQFGR